MTNKHTLKIPYREKIELETFAAIVENNYSWEISIACMRTIIN